VGSICFEWVAVEDRTYVVVRQDGKIGGGGANPYYTGSYSADGGRVKGELIVNTHTPYPGDQLFFGAAEIGVGFSGTYERDKAIGSQPRCTGNAASAFGFG
jgi:hypothetical protein